MYIQNAKCAYVRVRMYIWLCVGGMYKKFKTKKYMKAGSAENTLTLIM